MQNMKNITKSILFSTNILISQWSAKEIEQWSQNIKSKRITKSDQEITEILQVLNRAVEIDSKYQIRNTQLLSILFLIYKNQNSGRLLQILTGEGKSLTVSCTAVILCLLGDQVDIVTSSDVLAKRDCLEKKKFYSLFGLKCSHNIQNDKEEKPLKENEIQECYKDNINIVYGTAHSFQADILSHEFYGKGNRGSRKFLQLIVDEVDSMLVDSRNHRTLISSEQSGFHDILIILQRIWIELCRMEHQINPTTYTYNQVLELGETIEVDVSIQLVKTIINLIGNKDDQFGFGQSLQPFFLEYIEHKLSVWAVNATKAMFQYQKNKEYIVENDQIFPIDYQNTGVTQVNTQYSDGIHQFLQLKENVTLTNINLITNYSSNVGFFRRYKSNLYGLTGTLGSQCIRGFLQDTYDTDFVFIQPYKKRLLKELPTSFLIDIIQWKKKIAQKAEWAALEKSRCCLIICQTIQGVYDISDFLKKRNSINHSKILIYTDSQDESLEQQLQKYTYPGCVIISTNLAGRGTDIKISQKVEENGGLHVILTFLPVNSRVKEQAFGRAGRMGQNGSAQIIMYTNLGKTQEELNIMKENDPEFLNEEISEDLMNQLQKQMNYKEKLQISEANEDVKSIVELDELFSRFTQEIKNLNLKKDDNDYYLTFKALEFRFGLFLDILSEKAKEENEQKHLKDFQRDIENFFKNINKDYKNGELIIKPQDMLLKGFQHLLNSDKNSQARDEVNKAKNADKKNPICNYLQIMQEIQSQNFENIGNEFKLFQDNIQIKRGQYEMLEQTQNFYNEVVTKEIEEQIKIETNKLIEMQKFNFEPLQTNFQPLKTNIQPQQAQLQPIQKLNNSQIENKKVEKLEKVQDIDLKIQKENKNTINQVQQKYKVNEIEIKKQEIIVKALNDKLNVHKENIKQQSINFSHDKKQLQILESLEKHLIKNLDILKSANNQKDIEIKLDFENSTSLKSLMTNQEAFKSMEELEKELSNQSLPVLGNVSIQKKERDWFGCFFVIVSGLIQIAVGATITFFSCGAASSLGVGLIVEGCCDVFQGVYSLINNEKIDLKKYFATKIVSLTITCILAGQKALQETGELFKKGFEHISKNGLIESTKSFLSQGVIFNGLKKAGIKALEAGTARKIATQIGSRYLLNKTKTFSFSKEQFVQKSVEQIKNSKVVNQIKDMKEKEAKFKSNLNQISVLIQRFVGEEIRNNHKNIISKFSYLQSIQPSSNLIESVLNQGYQQIDIKKKDDIFLEIINKLSETIFDVQKSVNEIKPQIKKLLNNIFDNINNMQGYNEIKNSINIYDQIIKKSLTNYFEKKQNQFKDTLAEKDKGLENKQQKHKNDCDVYNKLKLDFEKECNDQERESQQLNEEKARIDRRRSTLNQYSQYDVDTYNNMVETYQQKCTQFNQKNQKIQQMQNNFKNKQTQINELGSQINQDSASYNSFVQNFNNSFEQEQTSIKKIVKNPNYSQSISKIFKEQNVFQEDDLTLNLQKQNRTVLSNKLFQLFQNQQFVNEILYYIDSNEFKSQQVNHDNSKSQMTEVIVDKTNQKIIDPLLQQCLNRLLSKDVESYLLDAKNLAFKQKIE